MLDDVEPSALCPCDVHVHADTVLARNHLDRSSRTFCNPRVVERPEVALWLISRSKSVAIYRPDVEPSAAENIREVIVGPKMPGFILHAQAVFDASIRRRPNI